MNQVVIYGMSHTGYRIASSLADAGAKVTAAVPADSPFLGPLTKLNIRTLPCTPGDMTALASLDLDRACAIILPSDDDEFNLSAALHAVEINSGIRVVLRLFNLNLGRKLEKSVRNFTVLSVSQLASSSFATSALIQKPVLAFKRGEKILNVYGGDGCLFEGMSVGEIEAQQEIKVIAVNDSVFPQSSQRVGKGDRLTLFSLFGTAAALTGIRPDKEKKIQLDKEQQAGKRFLGAVRQADKILLRTVVSLAGVAAACVLYFHFHDRLSFLDALYFVVTVVTTTGFGDISLRDSSPLSKTVGMALMLSGMSLMAMLFAIISDGLLRKRLDIFLGRRRMKLRGHVILCGMGDVGIRVLEDLLRVGQGVVVVEREAEGKFIPAARQRNVPLIISDAALEETLRNAGINGARAVICATDNDMRNLEIGLNAMSLNPGIRVVLRIFDKEFALKIQRHFGIPVALSSSEIAAPTFASAALGDGLLGAVDVAGARLCLKERSATSAADGDSIERGKGKFLMVEKADGRILLDPEGKDAGRGDKLIYMTEASFAGPACLQESGE